MPYKVINRHLKILQSEIKIHNNKLRGALSLPSNDPYDQKIWSVSLYFSLLGLFKNIIFLLENKDNLSGIFPLLRSCLDAYVNLKNVNFNYDKFLKSEKRKEFEEHKRIEEMDITTLTPEQLKELFDCYKRYSNRVGKLSTIEPTYMSEADKRKAIKLTDSHEGLYNIASDYVHLSHIAIYQSQMKHLKNGYCTPTEVHRAPIGSLLVCLRILMCVLWESILIISFKTTQNNKSDNFNNIFRQLNLCNKAIDNKLKKINFPFLES